LKTFSKRLNTKSSQTVCCSHFALSAVLYCSFSMIVSVLQFSTFYESYDTENSYKTFSEMVRIYSPYPFTI